MTLDLWCLVGNMLVGLGLIQLEVQGKTRIAGVAWNVGNRDAAPTFPPWIDRTGRALANHKENFPLFATAVVVAQLAGRANRVTAIASAVYLAARLAHAGFYVAGVTRFRTAAYVVGVLAVLAILSQLVV